MLAISKRGFGLRFALEPHRQVSTRAGRRYARPAKDDEIVGVCGCTESDTVVVATQEGHCLSCSAQEINKLENPGKGVIVIKTATDDQVIGFVSGRYGKTVLRVQTRKGSKRFEIAADLRR